MSLDARQIIKTHKATERSTLLRTLNNEYVFEVDKNANKHTIKMAIERLFKVKVDTVRTLVVPGKKRRTRYIVGKTSTWKKAIVRLKKGEVISMFENI